MDLRSVKVVISSEDIKKVAKFSSIDLDESQVEFFRQQVEVIISYCKELEKYGEMQEFDVDRPMNVFREDKVEPSPSRDVVQAFTESREGFLKIPKFLD